MDVEKRKKLESEQRKLEKLKRNPSILSALDSVHRSILWKNLQFEEDALHQQQSRCNKPRKQSTEATHEFNGSNDYKLIEINRTNTNRRQVAAAETFQNRNSHIDSNETSEKLSGRQPTTDDERNSNTCWDEVDKQLKANCALVPNKRNLQQPTIQCNSCQSLSVPYTASECKACKRGHACATTTDENGNVVHSKRNSSVTNGVGIIVVRKPKPTSDDRTMEVAAAAASTKKQKVITITIRAKQKPQSSAVSSPKKSPKVVTFHQSTPKRYSSDDNSSYTPSDTTSERRSRTPDYSGTETDDTFFDCHDFQEIIQGITDVSDRESDYYQTPTPTLRSQSAEHSELDSDGGRPLINIVQELSRSMSVTSTVTVNRSKLRKHRSINDGQGMERRRSGRKAIIGDDFCEEILSQTQKMSYKNYEDEEEDDKGSAHESQYSDGSFISSGSLSELAKPKYSGREMGKLLARRLKKAEQIKRMYAEYPKLDNIEENMEQNSFLYERQKLIRRKGPEKPKRTFANAPPADHREAVSGNSDTTMECTDLMEQKLRRLSAEYERQQNSQNLRRHNAAKTPPKPTAPQFEEILQQSQAHSMGWVVPKERHNNSIPPDILSMLHYSDDERRKRTILSSNSPPAPQKAGAQKTMAYPRLCIDTVDGRRAPSPTQQFNKFVCNARHQSTPRKPPVGSYRNMAVTSKRFLDMERMACDNQAKPASPMPMMNNTCESCAARKSTTRKSFRKAIRRTKTFLNGAKRKLAKQKIFRNRDKPKCSHVFSDPETYCTPDNSFTTRMNQQDVPKPSLVKHLGWTPELLPVNSHNKRAELAETPPRKPARQSLHFQNASCNTTPNLKELPRTPPSQQDVSCNTTPNLKDLPRTPSKFEKLVRSPLKKLNAIKVSPQKLFRGSNAGYDVPPTTAPTEPSYKSYAEDDPDVSRGIMREYLDKIRRQIEFGDENHNSVSDHSLDTVDRPAVSVSPTRLRRVSLSELPDTSDHPGAFDLHNEPLYAEINRASLQGPNNSSEQKIFEVNNKRYMIINDAIYTLVDKNRSQASKSKSMESMHTTNSVKSCQCSAQQDQTVDVVDAVQPTNPLGPQTQANSPLKPNNGSLENIERYFSGEVWKKKQACRHQVGIFSMDIHEGSDHDNEGVRPGSDGRASDGASSRSTYSSFKTNVYESEDGFSMIDLEIPSLLSDYETEEQQMAALGEELDQLLQSGMTVGSEKSSSPPDVVAEADSTNFANSTMVSSGGNTYEKPYSHMGDQTTTISTIRSRAGDDGYDTVDYTYVAERYENYCFPSDATCRVDSSPESSPSKSNNSSGSPTSPSHKNRSWTNKLRNSFRKSRKYLRYEQNRLVNLFEDKQKSKAAANDQKIVASASLEEYKKIYDDKRADNLYETLNKTLQQSGVRALAAEEVAKVKQINVQRSNKKQLLNARKICQSRPQFECSEELIEAERLLLLSDLNEAAAKRELIRIDNIKREQRAPPPSLDKNSGTISFTDFEFPLRDEATFDAIYKYYFVCAFTYKDQVRMTRAKEPNEGRVYFRKHEIRFKDVEPQFEIKMEVYALRLRKPVRNYSHESKFNLNKSTRSRLSSPKKLFQLSPTKSNSPSIAKSPPNRSDEFSNFKSQGCVTLTAYSLIPDHHHLDISRMDDVNASPFVWTNNYKQLLKKCGDHYVHHVEDSKPFKLSSVIYNSSLKGVFMMAIRSEIAFEKNEMSGFLNVGEVRTDSIVWNRRWCRIDGLNVLFYNDPQEHDETVTPILTIDLTKCIAEKIDMADRSVCARPRTFAIELFDKHHLNLSSFLDNNTKTFLLSADKNVELNMWLVELNKTLQFVRDWKV